jgi:hypothetical protein
MRHRPSAGLRYWWPLVVLGIAVCLYASLAGLEWWLQERAHGLGTRAMREFPGDEVEALSSLVQSKSHPLPARNDAIWALAQLADPRALPALQRLETGRNCEHERFVCQYELRKAIDRCSGLNQPPRWLRRLPFFPHPTEPEQRP